MKKESLKLTFSKLLLHFRLRMSEETNIENLSTSMLRYEIQTVIKNIISKEIKINVEKCTDLFGNNETENIYEKSNFNKIIVNSSLKKTLTKLGIKKKYMHLNVSNDENLECQKIYLKLMEKKDTFINENKFYSILIVKYNNYITHELLKVKSFVQPNTTKKYTKDFFPLKLKLYKVNLATALAKSKFKINTKEIQDFHLKIEKLLKLIY